MTFSSADLQTIIELKAVLDARHWTLSCAESCTGGLISAWIAALPGVSTFFLGSVVSYSGEIKAALLNVPRAKMEKFGEVSEPVALAMAHGTKKQMKSHWSLAVTGIAGPKGGSVSKPVGTVCFAFVGPDFEEVTTRKMAGSERQDIQRQTAQWALSRLLDLVLKTDQQLN